MPRIQLSLPQTFSFFTNLPVRITDINYGGHVGNDAVLGFIHEARMQFLKHHGLSELNFGGSGLIMSDVAIEFKQEGFYGDVLKAAVAAANFSRVGFDLFYVLSKTVDGKEITVAQAKTGMICFNYDFRKVVAVPEGIEQLLTA